MQGTRIAFGPFVLDPDIGTLLKEQIPIVVGHRGLTLLAALTARPGEILTKAELMDAAWPGTSVEEGNLTVQIATLRKALGPADNGGEWIATVPRVGYRFTGTVEPVASASRRPIPGSGKPSIAVLPFANLSGDQDQQYLSDGITEDIITELARFRSLLVIARNSSFQFRYPALDIAEVHRKLGVRYLVEGSIRKLGDRIRITTQLIDATTGTHLWAQRYDRALDDIFALQDEVAALIASMVEGQAEADSTSRTRRKPPADWDAYDCYLQGRAQFYRYELDMAEPLFVRCVELDATFAQGHAFLAQALVGRFWYDNDPRTLQNAWDSARTALALDRSDGVCHQSMGLVLTHMRQHSDAGVHFEQARSLNPLDVNIAGDYASWLNYGGRAESALNVLESALLRDPLPPIWFWEVKGSSLFLLRRYSEAVGSYQKAGDQFFIHAFLAAAYAHLGETQKARAEVQEALMRKHDLTIRLISRLPFAHQVDLELFTSGFRKAGFPA
ncbi:MULTISPECIES: winged helix-turn-helix domain-containing protein [unclassified Mesorhizobium]|uniref:winged helix-turn-helix domain-containing tetratricopeptide repeat protein n=1 Tax=unclassified Mesorhizobium TaxID=325217 RepID=UPI0003CF6FFD|nr:MULTISPECIES: winged helix-turn-helix domain-containing protein [unclassified Mesorhizobium]ESX26215.1 adenylate cyclase [Mesorhizobium sp. LSHC440B00]ESX35158.1 adenylate cyclase [Mesorhizobium sp. LSHC432A00]ESX37803.1 adenylate cyclase [Mesorhizobium sp. LSHC440A00]WJI55140.1 winged helix-turn-helix domain-containing protein [Mesorhizobium sp. C432A]